MAVDTRPQGNLIFSQVNIPPILQISQFENGSITNPGGAAGVAALSQTSAPLIRS
jgi:hypothetical protein